MGGGVIAGVPLQDDRGCAPETGEFTILGDTEIWRSAREHGAGYHSAGYGCADYRCAGYRRAGQGAASGTNRLSLPLSGCRSR